MRIFLPLLFFLSLVTAAGAWPSHLPPKPPLWLEKGGAAQGAQAVIKLKLGKKWKTYANQSNGEGIPPQFDWSGSQNLKKAQVIFPTPEKLSTLGVPFLGYSNFLALPIKVEAKDKTRKVLLRLKLSYAICDRVCVPLEEQLTLTLSPNNKI